MYWDNAAGESFFATLKNEMYHRHRFTNCARLHSSLDYKTPAAALAEHKTATIEASLDEAA